MSVLPTLARHFEQQRISPPPAPPPTGTWLREQVTEQPVPQVHSQRFKLIQWPETSLEESSVDREFQEAHVIGDRTGSAANYEQTQFANLPTLTEQAGELQYFIYSGRYYQEAGRDLGLKELEQLYVLEDRSEVAAFIERNRLRELLLEAGGPLNAAFGEAVVKKLSLLEDDEGFETLFCLALIPGDMHQTMLALESFDERWWLARSGRVGGKLNFDLELV